MTAPESKWVAEAMRLSDAICERNYDHAGYLAAANALRAHLQRQADLMERMGEALDGMLNERSGAARLSNACIDAEAALTAFQESKQ